ncbi:MAG: T9SS type A sorting domain-containing protein [Saprospiraceae bacterium]|nr:T9SS type A sorting domain-containing protein [Saprospiraceae bacterium]
MKFDICVLKKLLAGVYLLAMPALLAATASYPAFSAISGDPAHGGTAILSITCPNDIAVSCADQTPDIDVSAVTATSSCPGSILEAHMGDVISSQECANRYTLLRTYQATDQCGQTASCVQRIEVKDQLLPAITCPANLTVECAAQIPAVDPAAVTASDNCSGAPAKSFVSELVEYQTCANKFLLLRQYQATDACGNRATCVQRIRVADNKVSALACPPTLSLSCASEIPAPDINTLTLSDACGLLTAVHVNDFYSNQTCPNTFQIARTYLATDACQNTASCVQQIQVTDKQGPDLVCPKDITVSCNEQLPSVDVSAMTTSDACGGTVVRAHLSSEVHHKICHNQDQVTRTYQATDACGNTSTCAQHVEVKDEVSPEITCPPNLTLSCPDDALEPNLQALLVWDNCGGWPLREHLGDAIASFPAQNRYQISRTYRASDACSNSETCIQKIDVLDAEAPTISCPSNLSLSCTDQVPPVDLDALAVGDNCGVATLKKTHVEDVVSNQTCVSRFTLTRRYQVADLCGHTSTCAQTIVVKDETPPSISCPPNVTLSCTEQALAIDLNVVSASDNCGVAAKKHLQDNITGNACQNTYLILRSFLAEDACGQSATCSYRIRVSRVGQPAIKCPANLTVSCATEVPAALASVSGVTDNCGGAVTQASWLSDAVSGKTCTNRYLITRKFQATNSCGVKGTCTQQIQVNDQTPPAIACPAPVTVSCAEQVPASQPSLIVATDLCGGAKPTITVSDLVSNTVCNNQYLISRSYKAKDACGNEASCVQPITVRDVTPPSIVCPAAITVTCANQVTFPNPLTIQAADDCSGSVTRRFVGDQISNQICANQYTISRVFEVADRCGNTNTCNQLITVADVKPPSITCPPALTVSGSEEVPGEDISGAMAGSDNCSGPVQKSHAYDLITNISCQYLLTRVYQVSDLCGNTATCQQKITVEDSRAPQGKCPETLPVACAGDIPCASDDPKWQALFQQLQADFSDNSGAPVSVSVDKVLESWDCTPENLSYGRSVRVLIGDPCGNQTACTLRFSGGCYCTQAQDLWGSASGKIEGLSTTELIDSLLVPGWITIGNTAGCGLTLSTAPCVFKNLPAGGPAVPFEAKELPDCTGEIDNALVGELIALELNIRYNRQFRRLSLDSLPLLGACMLDAEAVAELGLPAQPRVGDLLALANTFLTSVCTESGVTYPSDLGEKLRTTVAAINGYWADCGNNTPCDPDKAKAGQVADRNAPATAPVAELTLWPNPTNGVLHVAFPAPARGEYAITVFDAEGKVVFAGAADAEAALHTLESRTDTWKPGLFWLSVAGETGVFTKRFIVFTF